MRRFPTSRTSPPIRSTHFSLFQNSNQPRVLIGTTIQATTTTTTTNSHFKMYSQLMNQQHQQQRIMATAPATTKALPKSAIFVTAGLGGCAGWFVVHPFNTVAVRMNLASAAGQTFSFSGMVEKQGLMSVYDGLSAGILRQVFYATSRFGLFETFRDVLHEYRGKTDFASR